MSKRYAYINTKSLVVENVIEWDGITPYVPPEHVVLLMSDTVQIGHLYDPDSKTFTVPQPPAAVEKPPTDEERITALEAQLAALLDAKA